MHIAMISRSPFLDDQTTRRDREAMVEAGVKLVNERFAPAWERYGITGTYYDVADDVPHGSHIFTWVDDDADVPGALGYHSQHGNVPYSVLMSKVIIESSGGGALSVGRDGVSCSSVFGHELLELFVNANVNGWSEMADGRFLANEVCDPVQDGIVLVTLDDGIVVAMSDGVFPEYFDPQAPFGGSYSLNGFAYPLGRTEGGYQIIFDPSRVNEPDGGYVTEWGATVPGWLKEMKMKRGRTARRISG